MQIVGELMTRDVVALKETQNLAKADELLRLHRIRHLPVVRQDKLVGLITHRDLLRAAATHATDPAAQPLWAADIMTRDVQTVRPDTPLRRAVTLMLEHKYGCLPVVDEGGVLQGILTEADLVRYAQHLIGEQDRRELAAEYNA
ncbi:MULTISPECIES: CBS domain-containing protein [Myxococcus]|uniref:CBS domain-containing protein n=1 Tax=Myxococcus xanthus TaxID=34 RepID=A0AAE6G206_MYXXA|nr:MULTISPECIES: CBS domain-containing protein [Myxococcus]QDE69225.1 CBS domain-containing protein [Myxococcus xanthus]QDE76501.1 CBS domain-containing protein [Myxococcus xanthus]QDE83920.1 CBS domain-containing protein [Myxococcus xanthus]QDE98068.1 CBS domain-containing protein [Myxococcus xanthus]QDF05776.1 CBS domain-containing protein [Myxococcus xanthus]